MLLSSILLLGAAFGGLGQIIRAIIGLNNTVQAAPAGTSFSSLFNAKYFFITLAFGVAVGAIVGLASAFMLPVATTLTKQQILLLISSGYTGSDALQGIFSKLVVPQVTTITTATKTKI